MQNVKSNVIIDFFFIDSTFCFTGLTTVTVRGPYAIEEAKSTRYKGSFKSFFKLRIIHYRHKTMSLTNLDLRLQDDNFRADFEHF
jgi:hypothetical protein